MKTLWSLIFFTAVTFAFAQVPKLISYQGVARNASGTVLANQPIGIKLELEQNVVGGPVVFTETHTPTTNQFGLFTLSIGSSNISGFASIVWGGSYFLKVSIDPTGGTSYTSVGSQQFMSVPYALYAQTSGNASITPTITSSGIAVVTPTVGHLFNVDVPKPIMVYNNATNVLTLTQGIATTTTSLNGSGSSTVSMSGAGIASVSPTTGSAFTVTVPNPVFNSAGPVTITGTYPNLTVNSANTASTTLIQGDNVSLNQSGNTYTVTAPAYSITSNSNTITLTNGSSVSNATLALGNTYVGTPNNISVTSNSINLTATGVAANIYGANSTNGVPTFSVDNFGRLRTATQYTPTIMGDVIGSINAVTVSKLRGVSISTVFPTAGQVLQFNSGSWTPNTIAFPTLSLSGFVLSVGAPTNSVSLLFPHLWSASSTTAIVQSDILRNVGIGVSSPAPQFKLDVAATAGNSVTIHGFNSGSTDAFAAVFGENSSSGIGIYGESNSGKGIFGKSTSNIGVYGESSTGDAGKFIIANSTSTAIAVNAQTNGTGPAIAAFNSSTIAAVTGHGIVGVTFNSSVFASGVYGQSFSSGPSIYGLKSGGSGSAGTFYISNTSNSSDAVFAKTEGAGAAVHALSAGSNTNSALALWVENGHIATTGATPTITVAIASITSVSLSPASTDVAGVIYFENTSAGSIPVNIAIVSIKFNRAYATPPVVLLSPANFPAGGDHFYVSNITTTGFAIRYAQSLGIGARIFNYMVIENK